MKRLAAIGLLAATLAACQSAPVASPAVLANADAADMARVKAALAKAMGQAQVELGPGDLRQTSVVSVLPRPPSPQEDRSLAKPTLFRLTLEGGVCYLVREGGGERVKLEDVTCVPAP